MTEIKRYKEEGVGYSNMEECSLGEWVKIDDHAAVVAALNEKLQALAEENTALISREEMAIMAKVDKSDFPTKGAAIRDIRAQGVESYANELRINGIAAKENGHDITADFLSKESSRATVYAARIRKGEQE